MSMTNNPENGALAEAFDGQLVANQKNKRKSTGPRTAAGKAIVALNGVLHGIQAVNPVLPGESPHVWRRFKMAMYLSLAPVGMVEIALAERITLLAWRQRRVTRFETESMRQALQEADRKWDQHFESELNGISAEPRGDLIARAHVATQSVAATKAAWDKFVAGANADPVTNEQAVAILSAALGVSGRSRWPEDTWPPEQAGFTGWTVALVRTALESINRGRRFRDIDQFTRAVGDRIANELQEAASMPRKIEQRRLENRRVHQLPDAKTCERVMRYEAHLARQFHRDLHELERLQAMRLGRPIARAIAIDVDVSAGAKSD